MKYIYRAIGIFLLLLILVWIPVYAWGNALFYHGFSPSHSFRFIDTHPYLTGQIQGVATGDERIAVYLEAWGQVRFYSVSGQYLTTLQLQRPGNGKGSLVFCDHTFWVRQPSGCVYAVASGDFSVQYWTAAEATDNPDVTAPFSIPPREDSPQIFQARGSIWRKPDQGQAQKIIGGSFLIWLLTGPALGYAIVGLLLLAAIVFLIHHKVGKRGFV